MGLNGSTAGSMGGMQLYTVMKRKKYEEYSEAPQQYLCTRLTLTHMHSRSHSNLTLFNTHSHLHSHSRPHSHSCSEIWDVWDVWDVGCVGCGMCGIWDVWDMGSALSSEPSALSPEPPSPGRSPSAPRAPQVHFFAKIAKKVHTRNLHFVSSVFIDVFERPKWKSSLKSGILRKITIFT